MNNWANQYYRNSLEPKQQDVYDTIYDSWRNKKTHVVLPATIQSLGMFEKVVVAIIKDHPELFWVQYYRCVIKKSLLLSSITVNNVYNDDEINRMSVDVEARRRNVVSQLPNSFSVTEQAWLLYDYLARLVTYGDQATFGSHTIIGPFGAGNHNSVCEGIAKSYKFLCDEAGIPCIVVFGKTISNSGEEEHAWNIIETELGKRHVDVTAEVKHAHFWGKASRKRFLRTDAEMTQYEWDRGTIPVCM